MTQQFLLASIDEWASNGNIRRAKVEYTPSLLSKAISQEHAARLHTLESIAGGLIANLDEYTDRLMNWIYLKSGLL